MSKGNTPKNCRRKNLASDPETGETKTNEEWASFFEISYDNWLDRLVHGEKWAFSYSKAKGKQFVQIGCIKKPLAEWKRDLNIAKLEWEQLKRNHAANHLAIKAALKKRPDAQFRIFGQETDSHKAIRWFIYEMRPTE